MLRRIFLTGPTASGKGAVAHCLAKKIDGEVVAVDSMKVFREMDIGTAKPSSRLRAEAPYHLIDFVDPGTDFSTGDYVPLCLRTLGEIEARGKRAILCGGTALYLNALIHGLFQGPRAEWSVRRALEGDAEREGLAALHARLASVDPAAAARIHPNDCRRIIRALEVHQSLGSAMSEMWRGPVLRVEPGSFLLFGIERERAALYRRIDARVVEMVKAGLFEEARRLEARSGGLSRTARQCIGYKEILDAGREGEDGGETVSLIQQHTRRMAKQQITWFKRFPISWFPAADATPPEAVADWIIAQAATEG